MEQDLVDTFAASVSEAEALLYAATSIPQTRDKLLAIALHRPGVADAAYAHVWRTKAAITRIIQLRQRLWAGRAVGSTRDLATQYQNTRRDLARMSLAPADPAKSEELERRRRALTVRKEQLERQLAQKLPEFNRELELARRPHTDLVARLPNHTVFLDLLRYTHPQDPNLPGAKGERKTARYVAFVLAHSRPVARVEVGDAQEVEEAMVGWRKDIEDHGTGAHSAILRRLVWEPLEHYFPPETTTVIIAPDARLTTLPWAALPGSEPGSYLAQRYAISLVLHGPDLLEHLTAPRSPTLALRPALVVGDVSYDGRPVLVAQVEVPGRRRAAVRGERTTHYEPLPASVGEIDDLTRQIGPKDMRVLRGVKATTARVEAELPTVRAAHFATHGFFADPSVKSVLQPAPEAAGGTRSLAEPSLAAGARNPLLLSGLVLAGANLPVSRDMLGLPQGDRGILTAEIIAGLPLQNLDLAVLSACETGLGRVAGGEGIFGLQRAFHLAGTRTVVASLWSVDDRVTLALMKAFYTHLSSGTMSAPEALRRAQLEILEHGFADSADPTYWAGWVVSGDPGQPIDAPEAHVKRATSSLVGSKLRVAWLLAASVALIAVLALGLWWRQRHRRAL
jgi:CHAT domain-containing protein